MDMSIRTLQKLSDLRTGQQQVISDFGLFTLMHIVFHIEIKPLSRG
jgi:hypothetical protein